MGERNHEQNVGEDDLDFGALLASVGERDLAMGTLSEEELYWFGPAAGRPVAQVPDLVALHGLEPREQRARLDAVAATLQARGELVVDDAGEDVSLGRQGPRATLVKLRGRAAGRTLVADSGTGRLVAVLHHLPVGVDLVQRPVTAGLHAFTATAPERAARWVAAALDPDGHALTTSGLSRSSDADELVPPRDELAAAATHAHTLTRLRPDRPDVRAAEVVSGPSVGVVALRAYREAAQAEYVSQTLSPEDLVAFCDAFLHASDLPGDRMPATG